MNIAGQATILKKSKEVFTTINNGIKNLKTSFDSTFDLIISNINNSLKLISEGISDAVNAGMLFFQQEEYIKVDTDKLRSYAKRLKKVRKK